MMAAYNVPHFIAQSIVFDTKYNIDNLEPVGNWGADPAVLIVGKDSKFNNVKDLVDFAKANPGKVTVSGAGKFVGHHIAHLQFAKASGADMAVAEAAPAAAAPAAAPSSEAQAASAGIEPPVLVELTDDMDPADKRAARIANSKAKSAYKKALKAAGISASAPAPAAAAAAPAAPAPEPVAAAPAGLDDVPKPDLVELTDDMDPAEKRAARIANSKAKSAYKKALKAAGIDPKSVSI